MEAKIQLARQKASRIQCVIEYKIQGTPFTRRVRKIAAELRRNHHTLNQGILLAAKQHYIDRIKVLMISKRQLAEKTKAIMENKMFREKPGRLFSPPMAQIENPPTTEEVENFWKDLYGEVRPLRYNTPALEQFKVFAQNHRTANEPKHQITEEEVQQALQGTKNFSAPGPDCINAYWWKKLTSTHLHLARIFDTWLHGNQQIPSWVVEGRTVLIPKSGDLSQPKNYRPITCLNACYKIFTRILYARLLSAIKTALDEIHEQRGSKRGVAGCKENLLIDRSITQDSMQYQRNLSMAWIDYRKAFDSTSHELILRLLRTLEAPEAVVDCIERLMPLWKTRVCINNGTTKICTDAIQLRRGVFQGDSLSPLLFCISLLPLSIALRNTRGYKCGKPGIRGHKVTHLFYMDDLKLYTAGERDLKISLRIVEEFTSAIGMELGLNKCAVIHLKRGRNENYGEDVQLVDGSTIQKLTDDETYTYLGIEQRHFQETQKVKDSLCERYRKRLRQIWSSSLSGVNKTLATNILATPIITYSFGVIKWTENELHQLDVITRKMMHMEKSLHTKSSVPRLYLPREQGGRGLLSLESLHQRVILSTAYTLLKTQDPLLVMVRDHEKEEIGGFIFKEAKKAANKLNLIFDLQRQHPESITEHSATQVVNRIRSAQNRRFLQNHVEKPVHGAFYNIMTQQQLSERLSFAFLRSSGLRSETEGFILACQDGVYGSLVYRSRIMGQQIEDIRCRACHQAPETLWHILSACPTYAASAYTQRHNAALRVIYYHLRHMHGFDETPVLPQTPKEIESLVENETTKIYWNYTFQAFGQIRANRPDIVLQDIAKKIIYVIEFSAPSEKNIISKEEEKREKYQELLEQMRRMYADHSVRLVVLVIGSLGGVKDTLLQQLKLIPACYNVAERLAASMQKAVILGSLKILRAHDTRIQ
ncbi:uncharacterized protein LOC115874901 [Sitophilus oryzae]|uniref:Uncharacterized protein LOC115874901 n=1 Tax=Sitophilus oryzae TaxID=7048 RepID=A0A6J2X548_SITOR|nr:uncharacterized protein LOC115874901 [Sitophilus oryzae]